MSVRRAICALASLLLLFAAPAHVLCAQEGPRSELARPGGEPAAKPAAPTTRLVYQLPPRELTEQLEHLPGTSPGQLAAEVVHAVRQRVGKVATVQALRGTQFEVVVAGAEAAVRKVRARIEKCSMLALRVVATDDFREDGVSFDLAREKARLQQWLDHGGRELVRTDRRCIDRFNDDPEKGPLAKFSDANGKQWPALRWYPHLVAPSRRNDAGVGGALANATVAVFDERSGALATAAKNGSAPFLLELVAVDMKACHFTGNQLDQTKVATLFTDNGRDAGEFGVLYQLRPESCADYDAWTQKYSGRHCAILVNGAVRSAPCLVSSTHGNGKIDGTFTPGEAGALAEDLRADEVPVTPVLLRSEPLIPK